MRLTRQEVKAITSSFKKIFGNGKIYLFGSRVDDAKKGGDIDLYIVIKEKENLTTLKIDFLVNLKQKIGEQKIDVIISRDKNREIEKKALKEGVELSDKTIKFQKYINECRKHKFRIEKSYAKVGGIFPLSAPKYEQLSDAQVETIDQYLFRFAKLQDTMGGRLFKIIVSEYVDNIEELTLVDILNKLEKINILDDANIWKKLRSIRNNISHQYDDEPQEMAEALNDMFAYKDELLDIFNKIDNFYKKVN
jgi:predicted nucleotidyltransferase